MANMAVNLINMIGDVSYETSINENTELIREVLMRPKVDCRDKKKNFEKNAIACKASDRDGRYFSKSSRSISEI